MTTMDRHPETELLERIVAEQAVFRSVLQAFLANLFTAWTDPTEPTNGFRLLVLEILEMMARPPYSAGAAVVASANRSADQLFRDLSVMLAARAHDGPPTARPN